MKSTRSAAAQAAPADPTRRSLLAGASVAAALMASRAALPAEDPDAALMAVRGRYERTRAVMDATCGPHNVAEEAFFALMKVEPEMDRRIARKRSGLTIAERDWNRALGANSEVIRELALTPARTIGGLGFKARVAVENDMFEEDLNTSVMEDAVALAAAFSTLALPLPA